MWRILIVEDDEQLAMKLAELLAAVGREADIVGTAAAAAREMRDSRHAAVLLDWNLPDGEGAQVLRQARQGGIDTPVLMLTGRDEVGDKVLALDAGADDYLCKPFDTRELIARLEALLRRSGGRAKKILRWGGIELHFTSREVFADGQRVDLAPMELRLLALVMTGGGLIVQRPEIARGLWGRDGDPTSPLIDGYMCRLRSLLGSAERWIETVRFEGYRMRTDEGAGHGETGG